MGASARLGRTDRAFRFNYCTTFVIVCSGLSEETQFLDFKEI
jgi:hypothetical protein